MDLNGKNVVISGGSSGIGLATSKQLINCNVSSLTILDIVENQEALNELKSINELVRILFIKTDVSNKEDVEQAFDKIMANFQRIDIVLCNAGISGENNMQQVMNVNFFGVVNMTMTAMPLMSKSNGNNGGTIMATASVSGLGGKIFVSPCYNASKHAIIGFFRALSHDFYFNKHNIKFLLICPGMTETGLVTNGLDGIFDIESIFAMKDSMESIIMQSADEVGKKMIDVLKCGENGTAWIADNGKLTQIEFKEYWP